MEEIFRNYKSFVEEKRNLKEQIDKIEIKRNELAKERNSKKATLCTVLEKSFDMKFHSTNHVLPKPHQTHIKKIARR